MRAEGTGVEIDGDHITVIVDDCEYDVEVVQ